MNWEDMDNTANVDGGWMSKLGESTTGKILNWSESCYRAKNKKQSTWSMEHLRLDIFFVSGGSY